ncbi:DUF2723 domain-containing protein [Pseudomonas floridensis]|uniref:DUF2723 domain-containing protein n=1 Tax=Pseudomonas floridensis TaxID=1958950 RepID=A0A1X0N3G7_9PSED|nr:DUF2723 domain-containing protein [Pseudomonas floridensis]ORC57927.1 DUF2723 domain-containing protein [Pseudomonas floridensis]
MTSPTTRPSIVVPLLLLCAAIAASFFASSGPVQWMDNGVFLADASTGEYFSQSLGPLDHPFYHLFSSVLYRLFGSQVLSLMNSLLLIPLAWIIYRLATSVGARARQALLAAATTVLAHAVFWVSTKAEVYLLHTLFVLLAYALHFSASPHLTPVKRLFVIGVLTGLSASVHQLTFIVMLPLYMQLLYQHRARILITVPGFLLGFASAAVAVINDLNAGMGLFDLLRRYLTGASSVVAGPEWEGSLFRFDDMWHEKNSVVLMLLSLIGPQIAGLLLFPRDSRLRLLWSAAVLNLIFAISYNVTDRFTFFLPGIAMLSIIGMTQLPALLSRSTTGKALLDLSVLTSPVVIMLAYSLYVSGAVNLPTHKEKLPFREDIHYFMVPYLQDRSAEAFVKAYERSVPEGALIIADWTPLGAIRSGQAIGLLRGRRLAMCGDNIDIRAYLGNPGVFLARLSYCGMIADNYVLENTSVGFALHTK